MLLQWISSCQSTSLSSCPHTHSSCHSFLKTCWTSPTQITSRSVSYCLPTVEVSLGEFGQCRTRSKARNQCAWLANVSIVFSAGFQPVKILIMDWRILNLVPYCNRCGENESVIVRQVGREGFKQTVWCQMQTNKFDLQVSMLGHEVCHIIWVLGGYFAFRPYSPLVGWNTQLAHSSIVIVASTSSRATQKAPSSKFRKNIRSVSFGVAGHVTCCSRVCVMMIDCALCSGLTIPMRPQWARWPKLRSCEQNGHGTAHRACHWLQGRHAHGCL